MTSFSTTSELLDAILSGRYNSIQKFNGTHHETCMICKKDAATEELLECAFCANSEHLSCFQKKLTRNGRNIEFNGFVSQSVDDFDCPIICHLDMNKVIHSQKTKAWRADDRKSKRTALELEDNNVGKKTKGLVDEPRKCPHDGDDDDYKCTCSAAYAALTEHLNNMSVSKKTSGL
jgi:hypothetical protein